MDVLHLNYMIFWIWGRWEQATELTPFISFECVLNAGEEGSTRLLDVHNLGLWTFFPSLGLLGCGM